MDITEIKERIPQRYPFLMIDRVVELELGKRIVAIKNLSANEQFFEGHFPGNPIMPGVMMIEAMAQAAGVLGFKTMDKRPADGSVYLFAGVDKVRFKRPVIPGDQLRIEAEYVTQRRGIWKFECKASVDGELACKATILCADR